MFDDSALGIQRCQSPKAALRLRCSFGSLREERVRMDRRETIIALLALGIAAGPRAACAQAKPSAQGKTLAVLAPGSSQEVERYFLGMFRAELKALQWIEGENLVVVGAFADFRNERVPALAEDLVRKRVDVVLATAANAAVAAARATQSIPIVFMGVPWPVETGLIDSFARPGRNVTGVSSYTGIEVSTKRLEFLKEVAPAATRLSWILDPSLGASVDGSRLDVRPMLDPTAKSLGYEVRYHHIENSEDVDPALAEILAWRAQAIAVSGGAATFAARERIATFALHNRLPSACVSPSVVEAGGLLSYSAAGTFPESVARGASYVDRILRGAHPADLPVYRPDKYELLINLKTARALGLQVTQSLLLRAGRVIE
jgi:putative ABC transport system substrate-binding protein